MAHEISAGELDSIFAFAVQLGKDAGHMLLEAAEARYGGSSQDQVEKESAVDIVTKTDEGRHNQTPYPSLPSPPSPSPPPAPPSMSKRLLALELSDHMGNTDTDTNTNISTETTSQTDSRPVKKRKLDPRVS